MKQNRSYKLIIEPLPDEDGGGFLATVPDLPGCMSDGETAQEAVTNVLDAIECWLDTDGHDSYVPEQKRA